MTPKALVDKCPECGGRVINDYDRQELVCTECGFVIGRPVGMAPGVSRAIGLPPSEQIRTAERLGLGLSRKTKKIIRVHSEKTCLRCKGQYTPTGNYQKYCPRCKQAQLKALRKYKRLKQRHASRIRSLKDRIKRIDSERKVLNSRIKKEKRAYASIHLHQFLRPSLFRRRDRLKKRQ